MSDRTLVYVLALPLHESEEKEDVADRISAAVPSDFRGRGAVEAVDISTRQPRQPKIAAVTAAKAGANA